MFFICFCVPCLCFCTNIDTPFVLFFKETTMAVSRIVYFIFQPAFLFINVAKTIAGSSVPSSGSINTSSLLLMPICALAHIILSSLISKIVVFFTKIDQNEGECRDARTCMSFVNSGTLPFIFAAALFNTGAGGNSQLYQDVSACLSFYTLSWSPTFWIYGKKLLLGAKSNKSISETMKEIFTPPVLGSLTGILVSTIPLLRKFFFESDSFLAQPIMGTFKTLGDANLPLSLIVLSGSLMNGILAMRAMKEQQQNKLEKQNKKEKSLQLNQQGSTSNINGAISLRTLLSILITRFILSPLMACFFINTIFSSSNNLVTKLLSPYLPTSERTKSILKFSILMEACMPPAQNSVLLLKMSPETAERGDKMARILTLIYGLSVLPVTALMGWALQSSGIMNHL